MTGFVPKRINGLERLNRFAARAGLDYARTRNVDFGADNRGNVSLLSPWLRHRLVSEEEVLTKVLALHSLKSAEKFVQEVCWRTYWKGWLELRPEVWSNYCDLVRPGLDSFDVTIQAQLQSAVTGATGIECFDYWCHELVSTGYLHNHARMWFASIWIFTLRLPWYLGADFFLRHLIDGDAASNTLSWRWVAGLQTVGKTYLAREDNIAKYTDGRFASTPFLAKEAHVVAAVPTFEPRQPVFELPTASARTAWLITDDDLMPNEFHAGTKLVDEGLLLDTTHWRSPNEISGVVQRFVTGALDDAEDRLCVSTTRVYATFDRERLAGSIVEWCRERDVRQLLSTCIPAGPSRDAVNSVKPLLLEHSITVRQVMREWDRVAWPFATKGFFNFRKHIPDLLERRGILQDVDSST